MFSWLDIVKQCLSLEWTMTEHPLPFFLFIYKFIGYTCLDSACLAYQSNQSFVISFIHYISFDIVKVIVQVMVSAFHFANSLSSSSSLDSTKHIPNHPSTCSCTLDFTQVSCFGTSHKLMRFISSFS